MIVKKRKVITVKTEVFEDVHMNFNEFIGYTLSVLRKQKNIKQEELAKKMNLSRVSIVNIEAGRQRLSLENLKIICQ